MWLEESRRRFFFSCIKSARLVEHVNCRVLQDAPQCCSGQRGMLSWFELASVTMGLCLKPFSSVPFEPRKRSLEYSTNVSPSRHGDVDTPNSGNPPADCMRYDKFA